MDTREAFVALNLIDGVGPVRVRQLLEHFGEAPAILQASESQLQQVRGIGEDTAGKIAAWERTSTSPANSNASLTSVAAS
jgi:DNA processing protein